MTWNIEYNRNAEHDLFNAVKSPTTSIKERYNDVLKKVHIIKI